MVETEDARSLDLERGLFEQSRVPTVILDLNERQIIAANAAIEGLIGQPREEIIGRPAADFLTEEMNDQALRRRGVRQVFTRTIREVTTADGTRTCEVLLAPSGVDGVVYVQLHVLDGLIDDDRVTTLRERGPADADRVFDSLPSATLVVDLGTRAISRVNERAESLLGASGRRLVGRPAADLGVSPAALDALLDAVNRGDAGTPESVVTMIQTSTGRRAMEITAVGLVGTPSAVLHFELASRRRPTRRRAGRATGTPQAMATAADVRRRRRLAQVICGAALASLGSVVLAVGWWAGVDGVTRLLPDLASMKANTALGFILFGGALLARDDPARGPERTARAGAWGALALLGLATAVQYVFELDFGIDELLAAETDLTATSSPGRMGLNTALCFLATGAGALLMERGAPRERTIVGQGLSLASATLAFLALVAYIYDASGSRGLASSTEMALHTAMAILVGTVGLLATQLDRGLIEPLGQPLAGSRFARRVLPAGLVLVLAAGLLTRALRRNDLVDDPNLELAFFTLLVTLSLFGVIVSVSRQTNRLDARAERARQDLAAVMAALSDQHFRVDGTGLAREVTGLGVSEPQPVNGLVPTPLRGRLERALTACRTDGQPTELTFDPDQGGGKRELRVAPLPSGEIAVSIRDISDLAEARDALAALTASLEDEVHARTIELEETNVELERSNADLEQFAYLASHDLQEPLRMVSTFVDKLATRLGDDLDDKTAKYVEFAVDGAERMSDLIDGLLQYSRAGRAPTQSVEIDLSETIEAVLRTLDERVAEVGATVVVDPSLPHVYGDELLVGQVLQNLLGNALKFTDPERSPEVRVDARRDGEMVEIGVADNGVGIAPEFRDQVFLMFRRLHSRASFAGTGIGLSLVQRLVESLGGKVWIDDDHGPHGTRFVFTLPATARAAITSNDTRSDR